MFIRYIFSPANIKRIKEHISLGVINGLTRHEAVLRGIKLADKLITKELAKYRLELLKQVEYLLVKHYIVQNARIADPMEEYNGKQINLDINDTPGDHTYINSSH